MRAAVCAAVAAAVLANGCHNAGSQTTREQREQKDALARRSQLSHTLLGLNSAAVIAKFGQPSRSERRTFPGLGKPYEVSTLYWGKRDLAEVVRFGGEVFDFKDDKVIQYAIYPGVGFHEPAEFKSTRDLLPWLDVDPTKGSAYSTDGFLGQSGFSTAGIIHNGVEANWYQWSYPDFILTAPVVTGVPGRKYDAASGALTPSQTNFGVMGGKPLLYEVRSTQLQLWPPPSEAEVRRRYQVALTDGTACLNDLRGLLPENSRDEEGRFWPTRFQHDVAAIDDDKNRTYGLRRLQRASAARKAVEPQTPVEFEREVQKEAPSYEGTVNLEESATHVCRQRDALR